MNITPTLEDRKAAATMLLVGEGWQDADMPPVDNYPRLLANVDLTATRLTVDTCIYDSTRNVWVDWRGVEISVQNGRLPTHYKDWRRAP